MLTAFWLLLEAITEEYVGCFKERSLLRLYCLQNVRNRNSVELTLKLSRIYKTFSIIYSYIIGTSSWAKVSDKNFQSLFSLLKRFVFSFLVPLRAPEISLTSRSPTDILISWLPIPAKYRRGQIVLYRLSFRLSTETKIQVLELPGTSDEYLLEGLRPDSVYLVRITAATRIGWGEASLWTSHRTPKATSVKGNS